MEPLISALLETVFGSLAEATGLSDWLRDRLGRDPEKLAFRLALTQALTDAAQEFPGANFRYFTETLRDVGGPLLARTLQPASPLPSATELTQLWLNHLTIDSVIHYRQEFTAFATLLLDQLNRHIENQQPLQWIVQARRQQASHGELQHIAASLEQGSAQSHKQLVALHTELSRLVATLEALTQPGARINTGGGSYLAGNAQVGRDWIGRDQVTIKNYFVAGLARLVVDYSARIQEFLLEYLGSKRKKVPFGGRAAQLAALDAWLADPAAPPYYLLSAEAGRGKSALVCRWLAQLTTHPDLAVIFLPISIRFETATLDVIFAALAARLATVFGEEMKAAALSAEEWKGVCQSYLRRSLTDGKQLLLILDGLDEATDWTPGRSLFPGDPPDGLHILVTARLRAGENNAQGWATTLGWQNPQLACSATLPPLDRRGVEEALASMGNPLDALATQVDVIGELHRISEGDPLLVRLYVDELVNQGERVRQLKAEDLQVIHPGLAGYFERWWQDQQEQWRRQGRDPIRQEQTLRLLLNALAAALGPLTHDDLAALHPDLGDGLLLKRLTQDVNRWLVGDGKAQGYSYSHPRLGHFFWEPLSRQEQAAWDGRFCDWGATTLAALNADQLDPKAAPVYLLRYYANHLERSQAPAEAFYALISNGWRQAWAVLDISFGGFLNDLERARQQTIQAYIAHPPQRAEALIQQLRVALCRSSVAALGRNLHSALLAQLVKERLYTPTQALAIVRLVTNEEHRLSLLLKLLDCLPHELFGEALRTAQAFEHAYYRAEALRSLAPYLPESERRAVLGEAMRAAQAIDNISFRAEALSALAPHLPASERTTVFREALRAAQGIDNISSRAEALSGLVPHLPASERRAVLGEALRTAQAINHALSRAEALSALIPHLPESERRAILEEALRAAREIDKAPSRALALSALIPHLPESEQRAVLEEALTTAQSIDNAYDRAYVFRALIPHLPESEQRAVLEEALTTAQSIDSGYLRAEALGLLIPHLPASERKAILGEALRIVQAFDHVYYSARVLSLLAPHLPSELLGEALWTTQALGHASSRATALSALVPYLPESERRVVLREALRVAPVIDDPYDPSSSSGARILSTLAPHLPSELLDEALRTAQALGHASSRAEALSALAPHLPSELLDEALQVAQAIDDEYYRAMALSALAPHLPIGLLGEALHATQTMYDASARALALSALAPHLPGELLGEALQVAQAIDYVPYRVYTLSALAPHLPENERRAILREALRIAQAIDDVSYRAGALSSVVPLLPESERRAVLGEALHTIQAIDNLFGRIQELSWLAPHLPRELLNEAFQAAQAIDDEYYRAMALNALAPHLSRSERRAVLGEVLYIVQATDHAYFRTEILSALAPHLPGELLGEALQATQAIRDVFRRASALSALAPHLPESERRAVLDEALGATQAIDDAGQRAKVLSALAPQLLAWIEREVQPAYFTLANVLVALGKRPRPEFLADVTILIPTLFALADDEAPQAAAGIYHAIQEVCGWWP